MQFKFRMKFNAPVIIILAAIVSSSCGLLGSSTCGSLALNDAVAADTTHGWGTTTSAPADPNADAGYLYGAWKMN